MADAGTISHRVILIRIPILYRLGMNTTELYEATRGVWRLNGRKARGAEYVFAVIDQTVREVYKPNAGSRQVRRRTSSATRALCGDRAAGSSWARPPFPRSASATSGCRLRGCSCLAQPTRSCTSTCNRHVRGTGIRMRVDTAFTALGRTGNVRATPYDRHDARAQRVPLFHSGPVCPGDRSDPGGARERRAARYVRDPAHRADERHLVRRGRCRSGAVTADPTNGEPAFRGGAACSLRAA